MVMLLQEFARLQVTVIVCTPDGMTGQTHMYFWTCCPPVSTKVNGECGEGMKQASPLGFTLSEMDMVVEPVVWQLLSQHW
jgi:hypothetical protein